MIAKIVICLLISKVSAQITGDLWWLNDKLAKYIDEPSAPKFENVSELDTDESAKIVFRDALFNNDGKSNDLNNGRAGNSNEKLNDSFHFQDESKIVWPADDTEEKLAAISEDDKNKITPQVNGDVFEFQFPEKDNFIWKDKTIDTSKIFINKATEKNKTQNRRPNEIIIFRDKPMKVQNDKVPESESICTFVKKLECNRRGGVVYFKRERNSKKPSVDSQLVCCILPISRDELSKIYFLDNPYQPNKRNKRSNIDVKLSAALQQRYALLRRKYASQAQKVKPRPTIQTKTTPKIVTQDDDYIDPYWNIKTSNFKGPGVQNRPSQSSTNKYDYGTDDYVEDYIVELPTPGLVGLYSDHAGTGPSWTFANDNKRPSYGGEIDDEEDDSPSFGYGATVDPRLDDRVVSATSKPQRNGRPAKMTTHTVISSEEQSYNSESQTINYQSNPDFQVLNGFKLLNLVRNKNKVHKNEKKTTTDSVIDGGSTEVLIGPDFETDYEDVFDTNRQVFTDCGKTVTEDNYRQVGNIGEAENGSHPWLALVVLTRRRQTILCYATLVHTRAAVTAADCVHGRNTRPGELTLIAGPWDLNDESHEDWQKRMATIHVHEQYRPGDLANNLAVLHWKRPLKLNANVQPACLTDPHVGDSCRFFGWGGYDQAIRPHSRWQRASILMPRTCNERLSSKHETLPSDAFCASVHSRGTVTGVGAPLMCAIGGRRAAAGVAIWRDNVVVMAPAQQWTMRVLSDLRLH